MVRSFSSSSTKSLRADLHHSYAHWKITGNADPAVTVLVELLQDINFQGDAIETLGDMGPEAKNAVPTLIEQLNSSEDYLRESAVLTLGAIGPQAKEALPALRKMKDDPDALIRSAAERAIREVERLNP